MRDRDLFIIITIQFLSFYSERGLPNPLMFWLVSTFVCLSHTRVSQSSQVVD